MMVSGRGFGVETVTATAGEGMPLATAWIVLAPASIYAGTSKFVDTGVLPVATPMLLCP